MIDKALTIDPASAEAFAALGLARWQTGQIDAAESALRQASELNKNYVPAQLWLAVVLGNQGRYAEQQQVLERAIELDPDYGRAYAALAALYWQSVRQGYSWTLKVIPDTANFVSFTSARVKAENYAQLAMRNPSPLAHQVASAMALKCWKRPSCEGLL